MLANWLYNRIVSAKERENIIMNLDFVLKSIQEASQFPLIEKHPSSVSIGDPSRVYIKPTIIDVNAPQDSRIILFSAPGATGKSALANYIACQKHAILWDLSKERIANHSLSGMLVETLGTEHFSEFTKGLCTGNAILVIDALDEAEMISGRIALETLLIDLKNILKDAICASVILCARTETAHYVAEFYSKEENKLPISQYEISFFEESSAKDLIRSTIERMGKVVTKPISECIDAQFYRINQLLNYDKELTRSFIGYAPVLEALSVYLLEESNTQLLLQQIENAHDCTGIFSKIMKRILNREQEKVINGFKTRCEKEYPDFTEWATVYSEEEQIKLLADYLIFEAIDTNSVGASLPRELKNEYITIIETFIRDHPFIHNFAKDGETNQLDFTGPAFRDYALSRLMTMSNCDIYAKEYFSIHKSAARFPSQLFFDFYLFFSNGKTDAQHFQYLYDAFKSKETATMMSMVSIEQIDEEVICNFSCRKVKDRANSECYELSMPTDYSALQIKQLSNAYIDIQGDILFGEKGKEVHICNSTIKCRKILLGAPVILLEAYSSGETLLACTDGIDASINPSAKFEIRTDNNNSLKISVPNIFDWYKLRSYIYELDDTKNVDIIKFENAAKTILKHFRKHGKDAPGRHREFIQNIIIGGSDLKKSVFDFFVDKKIIYTDDKDLSQYKLSNSALENFGVNWGVLSQMSNPDMKKMYDVYQIWQRGTHSNI